MYKILILVFVSLLYNRFDVIEIVFLYIVKVKDYILLVDSMFCVCWSVNFSGEMIFKLLWFFLFYV